MSQFDDMVLNMTQTTPEPEDYTGEDGLLYCGKCRKPKEAYFPEGKSLFGRDRHPAECDCQRAEREKREAAEKRRTHLEAVERLKQRGFTNPATTIPFVDHFPQDTELYTLLTTKPEDKANGQE